VSEKNQIISLIVVGQWEIDTTFCWLAWHLHHVRRYSLFKRNIMFFTVACCYPGKYKLTNSMEQRPSWEAKRFSASQKIPCILQNPTVRYRSHKCPPPFPILSSKYTTGPKFSFIIINAGIYNCTIFLLVI